MPQCPKSEMTDAFVLALGQAIMAIRKRRAMSRADLADAAGVSQSSVGHWEVGRSAPLVPTLLVVCEQLRVKPSDLISAAERHSGGRWQ